MKRVLLLAAALVAVGAVPVTAHAASWSGVVIAKNAKRKAVVTASRNGRVRTLRAPKAFRRLRVGRAIAVRAAALPDGTFAARAVKQLGRKKHVRVRAVVVSRTRTRLILSAGRSVFALRLRTAATAGLFNDRNGLDAGDQVSIDADCGDGGLTADEDDVDEVGHVDELELEGIYLWTKGDVLDLAVVHRGLVHVTIPDDVEVPEFEPGDEISLVVSVERGKFVLISAENEDEAGDDDDGVDIDSDHKEFIVKGVLASLSDDAVAVKVEGRAEPVRCAIRDEIDLSGFKVGQLVLMKCRYADGRFVLVGLRAKDVAPPDGKPAEITTHGVIVRLESWKVGVKVEGHDEPLYCKLRDGQDLRGFALGELVEIHCHYDQAIGWYVLASLKSEHAFIPEDGRAEFTLAGTLSAIGIDSVGVNVTGHLEPVRCAIPAGTDLSGFALGDSVEMHCHYHDGRFNLAYLKSDHAFLKLED